MLLGTVLGGFVVLLAAGSAAATPALAQADAPAERDGSRVEVTVVEVSGYLDRIQARFLQEIVTDSSSDVVVIRLDSSGAVAADDDLEALDRALADADVPVAVWLGPSKSARATGGSERVLRVADVVGGVPGARADGVDLELEAPTLGDFIVALDGRHGISIPTEVVRRDGRPPQRELSPSVRVSFAEPSFFQQMLHAVSTPTAAYLLVTAGLLLLVFEFFTGGIGVAGAVAVICLALGGFGLGALPTRPAGVVLLVAGVVGYAVDVQVGVPRAWTFIGTVLFAAGSFLLFDGLSIPLLVLISMIAAVVTVMVAGMPAVVRTRFATPTIGRESMIGEEGSASTDVAPEGIVMVRNAPWRARTNRATPIAAGEAVRVSAIDGLLLEVEPLEGAAEDYRERARSRR
ncbi:MAG TPA: NfeD family protein [Acidimicrobiales bacterium]|nr:NfeD family protein [Acidimicrobiales bacterium]